MVDPSKFQQRCSKVTSALGNQEFNQAKVVWKLVGLSVKRFEKFQTVCEWSWIREWLLWFLQHVSSGISCTHFATWLSQLRAQICWVIFTEELWESLTVRTLNSSAYELRVFIREFGRRRVSSNLLELKSESIVGNLNSNFWLAAFGFEQVIFTFKSLELGWRKRSTIAGRNLVLCVKLSWSFRHLFEVGWWGIE